LLVQGVPQLCCPYPNYFDTPLHLPLPLIDAEERFTIIVYDEANTAKTLDFYTRSAYSRGAQSNIMSYNIESFNTLTTGQLRRQFHALKCDPMSEVRIDFSVPSN
jgi:hypothetical protein